MKNSILTGLIIAAVGGSTISASPNYDGAKQTKAAVDTARYDLFAIKGNATIANKDINNIIFRTNAKEFIILSKREMEETEGTFAPLAWVAFTLSGAAIGAWQEHLTSFKENGRAASVEQVAWGAVAGGIEAGAGGAVGKALKIGRTSDAAAVGLIYGARGVAAGEIMRRNNPYRESDKISNDLKNKSSQEKAIKHKYEDL